MPVAGDCEGPAWDEACRERDLDALLGASIRTNDMMCERDVKSENSN